MSAAHVAIMTGAGNAFAVLDAREAPPQEQWAELARRLCEQPPASCPLRKLDGVLFVAPGADNGSCSMVVHNADGSRPQTCGNGIRCVAHFARERGLVESDELVVHTDAGACAVQLRRERGALVGARVDMGPPREVEREVELRGEFGRVLATRVDMGNPHCVLVVDDERSAPVNELGPVLERHARFPDRTNVEFVAQREGRWRLRVWERGVGETAACGTGACAAAVALMRAGSARSPLALSLPGGTLSVEWDGASAVWLTGPSEHVASLELELEEATLR